MLIFIFMFIYLLCWLGLALPCLDSALTSALHFLHKYKFMYLTGRSWRRPSDASEYTIRITKYEARTRFRVSAVYITWLGFAWDLSQVENSWSWCPMMMNEMWTVNHQHSTQHLLVKHESGRTGHWPTPTVMCRIFGLTKEGSHSQSHSRSGQTATTKTRRRWYSMTFVKLFFCFN